MGSSPPLSPGETILQHLLSIVIVALMSAEESKSSPAGRGADDASKNAGPANQQRSGNKNKQNKQKKQHQNNSVVSTFKGEDPDLGAITVGETPSKTKSTFEQVDRSIRHRIGRDMDELTLKSIETGSLIKPDEYKAEMAADGTSFKDDIEKMKYEINYKANLERLREIQKQIHNVYYLYYGQCSTEVKSILKEDANYEDMIKDKDVFKLRKMLQSLSVGFKNTKSPVKTLFVCLKEFMLVRQHKNESNSAYLKRFKGLMETVHEMIGGKEDEPFIYAYASLLKLHCKSLGIQDHNTLDLDTRTEYMTVQHGKMEAMHFLLGADQDRYGGMILDFDRHYLTGVDMYPVDLTKAYNLLTHWHGGKKQQKKNPNDTETEMGVSFNTVGDQDGGGDDIRKKCDRCGRYHKGTCTATAHKDGTVLHVYGSVGETESGDDDNHWEGSKAVESSF